MNINEVIYQRKGITNETRQESKDTYLEVLNLVRAYINKTYRDELVGDLCSDEAKNRYDILIRQTIQDKQLFVEGLDENQLAEKLYNSMAKYDFLTPYLECGSQYLDNNDLYQTWEEINCNSWDDVEVVSSGNYYKLEEIFHNSKHCVDIVKKLVRLGGLTLDVSNPRGDSFIGDGIRITATVHPCVDEETGATFSIRRQKKVTNDKEFFIENQTASEEELDFLTMGMDNGASVLYAGNTGAGKTTDINYILNSVDISNRIYSIEDARELNAVKRDKQGKVISRVVHTVTRESSDDKLNISAQELLKDALRYDPDIIALGEMRGKEAKTTIEAGNTGHTIITGLHSGGRKGAYRRICSLYMDAGTALSEKKVYENIVDAIPIIVHKKAFKSGERRYMSISEAYLDIYDGQPEVRFNTIYRFIIESFERDNNGKLIKVIGKHKQVGKISDKLAQKLFENGVSLEIIKKYAREDFNCNVNYDED